MPPGAGDAASTLPDYFITADDITVTGYNVQVDRLVADWQGAFPGGAAMDTNGDGRLSSADIGGGIDLDLQLQMAGFYPHGGGQVAARIAGGSRVRGLHLTERGRLVRIHGLSAVADLPQEIAERQRMQALKRLDKVIRKAPVGIEISSLPARSRGTLLLLLAEFEHSKACFFALGARGKRAESVADEAVDYLAEFLSTRATLDYWMADQLLLPLSLAGEESVFVTSRSTQHLMTNAEVIKLFLPVQISIEGTPGETAKVSIGPLT